MSSTHAPRNTGDVRSPYEVRISTAALPSNAPALFLRQRDLAELGAGDAGNTVVARQAVIQERVVGGQQIHDVAIFQKDAADETLPLLSRNPAAVGR